MIRSRLKFESLRQGRIEDIDYSHGIIYVYFGNGCYCEAVWSGIVEMYVGEYFYFHRVNGQWKLYN